MDPMGYELSYIVFFKEPTVVLQVEELTKIMSQIICPYHDNVWVSEEQ